MSGCPKAALSRISIIIAERRAGELEYFNRCNRWLTRLNKDIQLIWVSPGARLHHSFNRSFARASGDIVILIGTGIALTECVLHSCCDALDGDRRVGIIGAPVTGAPGIMEAFFVTRSQEQAVIQCPAIPPEFMVLRRECFANSELFDERFSIPEMAALDLCRRARDLGMGVCVLGGDTVRYIRRFPRPLSKEYARDLGLFSDRQRLIRKCFPELSPAEIRGANGPAVSVLMPTFNRKSLLPRAIRSVLDQTFTSFELIVVNDGGEDVTEVVDSFKDDRIVLASIDVNRGKSYALNRAIAASRASLVAYLDDDDIYYPDHLARCVGFLEENPHASLAYTDSVEAWSSDAALVSRKICSHEFDRRKMQEVDNYLPNLAIVHRKSLFEKAGSYDENLGGLEDWDMLRRFSAFVDFHHIPAFTGEFTVALAGDSRNTALRRRVKERESVRKTILAKSLPPIVTAGTLIDEAMRLMGNGMHEQAAKFYEKALELSPNHHLALEGLGRVLLARGHCAEAAIPLRLCRSLRPDRYESHVLLAEALIGMKELGEAIECIFAALVTSDDIKAHAPVLYRLEGTCRRALGEKGSVTLGPTRYLEDYRLHSLASRLLLVVHPLVNRDLALEKIRIRYSFSSGT
jgi:GT2 family glycosyltransferase